MSLKTRGKIKYEFPFDVYLLLIEFFVILIVIIIENGDALPRGTPLPQFSLIQVL
jgi:hypothetical protein